MTLAKLQGNADVYCFDKITQSMFGGKFIDWNNPISKRIFLRTLQSYQILHYHYPYQGLKEYLEKKHCKNELVLLKHYHGDDLRGKREKDFCLVSTPDLLSFASKGEWLPNPLDLEYYNQFKPRKFTKNTPTVIYYPAHKLQPTVQDNHTKALQSLEREGKCRLIPTIDSVHQIPSHHEIMQRIADSDIVVGKIRLDMGWFGKFELEGMTLGKPVIAYVSDELYTKYKPPIYRTTKDTFKQDLETLLCDKDQQKYLSKAGREYILENHDGENIISELQEYYMMARS